MKKFEKIYNIENIDSAAKELKPMFSPGHIILLEGNLGAGKTTLVRAISKQFNVKDNVCSPTFGLVQVYESEPRIVHVDVYRLNSDTELDFLDLDRYFDDNTLVFIEWGTRFDSLVEQADAVIRLTQTNHENERKLTLTSPSPN